MTIGSKPGPTTNTSSTSTSNLQGVQNVSLPDWYTQYFQGVLGAGADLYNNLNYTTMGMTPDQWMASNMANQSLQNYYNRPQSSSYDVFGMGSNWAKGGVPTATQAGGVTFGPQRDAVAQQAQFKPGSSAQLQPGDIPGFLNPYIETAMNPALDRLRRQQGEVQADIGGKAAASGMFGGSREAVGRSLADRNYRDTLANTAGNMLSQGWDKASGLASGNTDREQQMRMQNASLENQMAMSNAGLGTQASLANAQNANALNIAGGQLAGQLGMYNAGQQNDLMKQYYGNLFSGDQNEANRYLTAIAQQNGIDTNTLAALMQGSNQLNQFGTQQQATGQKALDSYWGQLNFLAALLSAGRTGQTTTTNNVTNTTGNTTGTSSKPIDLASIAIGGLGLLSDKDDKTDIKKLGKDPKTGVDMYAYRYKDDPKSYPKVVGPMAQDLELALPGVTRLLNGHRIIKS